MSKISAPALAQTIFPKYFRKNSKTAWFNKTFMFLKEKEKNNHENFL
jgi:hypothetical protein